MRALLSVFASVQVLTGAGLWLTPGFFHDEIGPYGVRNDHYMGDLATWYLALGAATFVADPGWLGPVNLVSLLLATLLLGWMLRNEAQAPAR